jgi:hypothetical protein
MRTVRYAHGSSWDYLDGNAALLVRQMAATGYYLVESSNPERRKDTNGILSELVAALIFDNEPQKSQSDQSSIDSVVVYVSAFDLAELSNKVTKAFSEHGKFISISGPVLTDIHDSPPMLVSTLLFEKRPEG